MNHLDLAPGLTRVQSLDPEDDDSGGIVLNVTASGGVLVRWDGAPTSQTWTTANSLCREGERPDRRAWSQCDEACELEAGHAGDHDPKTIGDPEAFKRACIGVPQKPPLT